MKVKKIGTVIGWFCLVTMVIFLTGQVAMASQKKVPLRMATAPVGAIMYTFGAAMSEVIGKHGGPNVEVLPQMQLAGFSMFPTKECDLVMVANDDLYHAYMGTDVYEKLTKGKGVNVRLLMLGTRIPAGQVVAGDSGIKTYEDLRGKRVFLRFGAALALRMGATAALYGGGLTEKDVKVMTATNLIVATRMVIEGKADATYGSVGVPIFRELAAARGGARHLGIVNTPENWAKVQLISPAYFPMKMKKGPLTVPEDIVMVGRNFGLTARADLSDDAAYIVTKLLWENDKELGPKHPRLKDWIKERFVSTKASAPYHPGAIKFYKEVGVWKPEHEEHNQKMLSLKK